MSNKLKIYSIQKSVYSHSQLIGYLTNEKSKKLDNYVYMPISVLLFGLLNDVFKVDCVRLDVYNKPYGLNGFSLQKLPRVEVIDSSNLRLKLIEALKYVLLQLDKIDTTIKFHTENLYGVASSIVTFPEYLGLSPSNIETEILKSLSFYYANLPTHLKDCCDFFSCKYIGEDRYFIAANKSLVKDVV